MTLAELFPDEDYRFSLRFSRREAAVFFGRTERHTELLAERRRWLHLQPNTCAAALPEGEALVEEAVELARK